MSRGDIVASCARFDMAALARDAGTVVSAVMFGAIAGSRVLPFGRGAFEAVLEGSGRAAQANRAGFARAVAAMEAAAPAPAATAAMAPPVPKPAAAIGAAFPVATHDFIRLGCARVEAFQDRAYADLYLARLVQVLAAERKADPAGEKEFELTRETARYLALWMAFDDIVRVADLKCRASRFARVRQEVAAGAGDIVRIVDYFKPGLPEFSALLPRTLAQRLARWDRRRQRRGKRPLAMAVTLHTDGIAGFLALRALASLRWLRRHGERYAQEQAAIERWLAAVDLAARDDWQLAFEIALSGRLIKGYGATNERGKENLAHILDHLAFAAAAGTAAMRALAIREAREAALADEGGAALDQSLVAHGAPPRPVKTQPIRWAGARIKSRPKLGDRVS